MKEGLKQRMKRLFDEDIMITESQFSTELNKTIARIIKEHSNCTEYHNINGKPATCVDMIILDLDSEMIKTIKQNSLSVKRGKA